MAVHRYASVARFNPVVPQLTALQADSIFSGISTFGRLPYHPCLKSKVDFDIAFIGESQLEISKVTIANDSKVLPLTPAHRTVQVPVLDLVVSDKVLAASISSTFLQSSKCLLLVRLGIKAHAGLDLVADTMSH